MDSGTVQTPLVDLLRAIPTDEKLRVEDHKHFTRHYPIGSMAHSAADRIADLERTGRIQTETIVMLESELAALKAKLPTVTVSDRECADRLRDIGCNLGVSDSIYEEVVVNIIAAHVASRIAPLQAERDRAVGLLQMFTSPHMKYVTVKVNPGRDVTCIACSRKTPQASTPAMTIVQHEKWCPLVVADAFLASLGKGE